MAMPSDIYVILSFSIDENISWGIAFVKNTNNKFEYQHNYNTVFEELRDLPGEGENLHLLVRELMRYIHSIILNDYNYIISSIGISTIGVVDVDRHKLISARQRWEPNYDLDNNVYLVDFKAIVDEIFGEGIKISTKNNATAKALAEFTESVGNFQSLFYITLQTGLNGSFIFSGANKKPVILAHPEIGHTFPPTYSKDHFYLKHSGCPIHKTCFLGLASGLRIHKQWGDNLINIQGHEDNPWDIISFYIAHLCWNAVLTVQPHRIVLAGLIAFDEFLPLVRAKLAELNTYEGRIYFDYPELSEPDFIYASSLPTNKSGVYGGLELARLTLFPGSGVINATNVQVRQRQALSLVPK